MEKRGQVTTFMIIGFVVVIIIVLIFGLRQAGIGINPHDYLDSKISSLDKEVKSCVDSQLQVALDKIGKQGGLLEVSNYRMHNGNKVNYLCYNIPNAPECLNNMIFVNDVEKDLEDYLNYYLPQCIDLDSMSQEFFFPEYKSADLTTNVEIRKESVVVTVNYPVTLIRGDQEATLKDIHESMDVPLGKLLDTTYDIVNSEARDGLFFSVPYMIANRGDVEIFVDQEEYPDKVYILNERNSDYIFEFAIEGEQG